MQKYLLVLTGLLALIVLSCEVGRKKSISEGEIEYDIEYDSVTLSRIDKKILPSVLIVKFRDNNTINIIEALSGALTISIISQPQKKEFTTLLKVFNKKLYHNEPFTNGQYPALYSRIPQVAIDSVFTQCELLGYSCNRVQGYYVDEPENRFEIIYTQQIAINNPNQNTPFERVDGVMLAFRLKLNKINMNLKAKSIKDISVLQSAFEIPNDYKKVDFQTMTDLIYLLQQ